VKRSAVDFLSRTAAFGDRRTLIAKEICELRNPEAVVAG
jgi:hypothetical protein